ncbi:MAG: putative thiazole-containing bacteriocin maturation protein [Bacillus sp. (in: firmicutes)]
MTNLAPSMCLKVKRDTFFIPDSNGGVYFRNNLYSFRMEGSTIAQWIEKLVPMFNGEHTLQELTDGLPGPYRDRVYEIAAVLYENGFVQDLSQDQPHRLADDLLDNYASQIEFLDYFGGSGAYRFQTYRQMKVLAIGSGPFFVSLVSALLQSGLPAFHMLITDSVPTNRQRLRELVAYARKTDSEVAVEEIGIDTEGEIPWREAIQSFNSILYVSHEGNLEELRELHAMCRQEGKLFFPAISLGKIGMAGPLVHPESEGCWESAWRRIHQSTLSEDRCFSAISSTAEAMLANVLAFEWFKEAAGVNEPKEANQVYLLDMETLEGDWHSFLPHPLIKGKASAKWIQNLDRRLEQTTSESEPGSWFISFSKLTSAQTGIFHSWEEGDLEQLPLAQCRVRVVDPLADGPAGLLPDIICASLTHEEARREAGLAGVEAYASQIAGRLVEILPPLRREGAYTADSEEYVGIGTGETFAECVCRGLQRCLEHEFSKQTLNQQAPIIQIEADAIEDERCLYYLQALTTMRNTPTVGIGKDLFGFPVAWVGIDDRWHGCVGLNITTALRNALQNVIMNEQVVMAGVAAQREETLIAGKKLRKVAVPKEEEIAYGTILQSALQILEQNRKRLSVIELELEPFFQEELAGVFGILLREGDQDE